MNAESVVSIARAAMETTLLVSAPMLVSGLVIGLIVSIFKAVTSIQEMTLTFIPKIVVVFVSLVVFAPWMMEVMISFTTDLFNFIPTMVR